MSVIIRLQNLPWSANALDIRQFFRGLNIPEGGVHIVGGELGDAFIAFSTDEDARQAFQLNNGKIKEVQIKLLLSSRTEMQKVIEAARTAPFMQSVLPPQPALIPQAPIITSVQTTPEVKKDDKDKSKDDTKRRSRDRDRDRSRRRSRSRSRSRDRRDRSKDRRDRRRRDRSRSRDRRRDRRRRSRSRERTRSRDRDTRRNRDDKKDQEKPNNNVEVKEEASNNRAWEKNDTIDQKPPQQGLLGNYPGPTSLEEARRSLGLLTGLQTNNNNNSPLNNINNRMPRNDLNNQPPNQNRDNNWQRKTRFENNEMGMNMNQFNPGNMGNMPMRPNMNQNMSVMMPNMFPNQNMRMPMQQMQENFGMNRPFLQRPGTSFPEQFKQDPRYHFDVNNEDNFRDRKDRNSINSCVQLRPYFGGYGEVRKFFHGLFISNTGVKFHSENGKRTGIVYIKFVYPNGKEQALDRSGMLLKGIPVEVTHLDDEIWERCGTEDLQKFEDNNSRDEERIGSPNSQHFTCVLVDDLPEFAKDHDILKLFSDYTIVRVHVIVNKQYKQQAYVQFSKEDDAKNAVADKKTHVIGGKPVTVCAITDDTFNEIVRQQGNGEMVIDVNYKKDSPNNFQPTMHIITDCVMMSGLPQKISDRDIRDFFSDIGVIPVKIHIMMNKFIPNGDCFCEFNSPDDAINALDKNNMPLGMNTIRVELCHRRDMERALSMSTANSQMNTGPRFPNRFGPRGPNMMGGPRPPPNMRRRLPLNQGMRFEGPVDNIGPQGCVVAMENVPFKAGVDEILIFFGNFELVNEDVFRRYNDNGAPTGDARVNFKSPSEAHRAVEECNKLKIRDRTIFLRVL